MQTKEEMTFNKFDTAPKTGEEILVIDRYGKFHVTHFDKIKDRFVLHGMPAHESSFSKWHELPQTM
jgi:hypothetical protein